MVDIEVCSAWWMSVNHRNILCEEEIAVWWFKMLCTSQIAYHISGKFDMELNLAVANFCGNCQI